MESNQRQSEFSQRQSNGDQLLAQPGVKSATTDGREPYTSNAHTNVQAFDQRASADIVHMQSTETPLQGISVHQSKIQENLALGQEFTPVLLYKSTENKDISDVIFSQMRQNKDLLPPLGNEGQQFNLAQLGRSTTNQSPRLNPLGMQADAQKSARSNLSKPAADAYRGNKYGTEEVMNRNHQVQEPVKLDDILEGSSISRREVTTLGLKARKQLTSSMKGSSNRGSTNRYQSTKTLPRSNVRSAANKQQLQQPYHARNVVTRAHLAAEQASQSTHGDQSNMDVVHETFNSMPRYQMPLDSKFKTPMDLTQGFESHGPHEMQLRVDGHLPLQTGIRSQMQWSKQQHGRPMGTTSGYVSLQQYPQLNIPVKRVSMSRAHANRGGRKQNAGLKSTEDYSSAQKRADATTADMNNAMMMNMSDGSMELPGHVYHSGQLSSGHEAPYSTHQRVQHSATNVMTYLTKQRAQLQTSGQQRSTTNIMTRNQRVSRTNQNFYPVDQQQSAQTILTDQAARMQYLANRNVELVPLEGQKLNLVSKAERIKSRNGGTMNNIMTQGLPQRDIIGYTTSTLALNSLEAGLHPQTVIIDEQNQMGRTFDEADHIASRRNIEFYQQGKRQATSELRAMDNSSSAHSPDDNLSSGLLKPAAPFPFLHESSSSLQIGIASPSPYQRATSHLRQMREKDEAKMLTLDRSKLDGLLDKKYSKKIKRRIYDDVLEYADKQNSRNEEINMQMFNSYDNTSAQRTAVGASTTASRLLRTTHGTMTKSNMQIAPQSTTVKQTQASLSKDRSSSKKRTTGSRDTSLPKMGTSSSISRLNKTASGARIQISSKLNVKQTKLNPYRSSQDLRLSKNSDLSANAKKIRDKALMVLPKAVYVENVGESPRKSSIATPEEPTIEDQNYQNMSAGPETQRLKEKAKKERKSSPRKSPFMKQRVSRKLAVSSTKNLQIKGLLPNPKQTVEVDPQASYAEIAAVSPTSSVSSGLAIGSLALGKETQANNERVQRFEAGFARLQRSNSTFQSLKAKGYQSPTIKMALAADGAYADGELEEPAENVKDKIKALKGQITSTRFYLENVVVADSETKHRLFKYDQNLQAEAMNTGEPPKALPLGNDGQPQGQSQIVEVVQNNVPVLCKVELPPEVQRRKPGDMRPVELRFRFRRIVEKQDSDDDKPAEPTMLAQGKGTMLAMKFASKLKKATAENAKVKKQRKRMLEAVQDLQVYVSAVSSEPNETTPATSKFLNTRVAVFHTQGVQDSWIYFTLKSVNGCKVKVSLEYLGEFALKSRRFGGQQDEDDEREKVAKPKYQRFSFFRNDGPFDYDCMDLIYPQEAARCRNRQDKEKLFDRMIDELDEFYADENAKILQKQKKQINKATFMTEGEERETETPNFVNLNHYTQGTWTQTLILGKLRSAMERRMFRQMLAMERREQLAVRLISQYKADAIKWDVYRERRQQAADFFIKMVWEHRRACHLVSLIQSMIVIKRLQEQIIIRLQKRDKQRKEQFIYNRICFLFKTEYCRYRNPDQTVRLGRQIVQALSYGTLWWASTMAPREYGKGADALPAPPQPAAAEDKGDGKKGGKKKEAPKLPTYNPSIIEDRAKPLFREFLSDNWHAKELESRLRNAGKMQELERRVTMTSLGMDLRQAYLHRRIIIERDFLVDMFDWGVVAKTLSAPNQKKANTNKKELAQKLKLASNDHLLDKVKSFIEVYTLNRRVRRIILQLPRLKELIIKNSDERKSLKNSIEAAKNIAEEEFETREEFIQERRNMLKQSRILLLQLRAVETERNAIGERRNDMTDAIEKLIEKARAIVDTLYVHSEQVAEEQTVAARKEFSKEYASHCKYKLGGVIKEGALEDFRREWSSKKTVCSDIKKKKKERVASSKSPEKRSVEASDNNRKSTKKGKVKEAGAEDVNPVVPQETNEVRAPAEPCQAELDYEAAGKLIKVIDKLLAGKEMTEKERKTTGGGDTLQQYFSQQIDTLPPFQVEIEVEQLHRMIFSAAMQGLIDQQEMQQGAGTKQQAQQKQEKN